MAPNWVARGLGHSCGTAQKNARLPYREIPEVALEERANRVDLGLGLTQQKTRIGHKWQAQINTR